MAYSIAGATATTPWEALLLAAFMGDNESLAQMLESRHPVNANDCADALQSALMGRNSDAIPLLLPHLGPTDLDFALICAAEHGNYTALSRLLVDPRANPTQTICGALSESRRRHDEQREAEFVSAVELLLADPRTNLQTALEHAINSDRLDIAKLVLARPRATPQVWKLERVVHWPLCRDYPAVCLLLDDGRMPWEHIAHGFQLTTGWMERLVEDVDNRRYLPFDFEPLSLDDHARAHRAAERLVKLQRLEAQYFDYLVRLVGDRRVPLDESSLLAALRLALQREQGKLAATALLRLEESRCGGRLVLGPEEHRRAEAFFRGYLGRERALAADACRALLESERPAWAAAPGEGAGAAGEAPALVYLVALGVVAPNSDLAASSLGPLFERRVVGAERERHGAEPEHDCAEAPAESERPDVD